MYMPPPAMHQAMMAPNGPVARPNVRGSEKIPAPTIEPTTIAVKANRENLSATLVAIAPLLGLSMHRIIHSGADAGWIRCRLELMNSLIPSVGRWFEKVICLSGQFHPRFGRWKMAHLYEACFVRRGQNRRLHETP